ncbi:iron-containing alcohol dehydrogenase [Massilioclostridium coli]|uniref:iron-containing alcohol dehydrogenase n=1 Tax=Massilioclostridium coli TaxID=1870991 RepID=UPI00085C52F5|nr:iron-containing alcohol dehydrogenase [Massilioclostridium coli]
MEQFIYHIPTKIYFGKGQIEHLADALKPYGNKVLLVYGSGSIKKNGIYDRVTDILKENGFTYEELSGVEPNPRITTVRKGVQICKQKGIEVVLPIGGGSTIDCAKVVAAGACYDGDPWDIVQDASCVTKVLPIVTILTLSATGSEMDTFAVISDMDANDKLGTGHPLMRPMASILDPSYTETVSAYQTAAGTADIMSHIFEAYFSNVQGYMQDRMAEGLLKTCIHYGAYAVKHPDDYEARANLMWASSWAINDFLKLGKVVEWTVHPMEHELSAYYDITHGVGLAILTPHWMRYVLNDNTVKKFREYGINVWGISSDLDDYEIANKAIDQTAAYFKEMGLPSTLTEVGIGTEKLDIMAQKAASALEHAYMPLNAEQVKEIYMAAL